jgi:hypothetical protein
MSRVCGTCQHLKRPEIDRCLAAGEPTAQVARDYQINPSSLHRHRTNCLNLGSANVIKKEVARGSAAVALLPSKETLSRAFTDLASQIDGIIGAGQSGWLIQACVVRIKFAAADTRIACPARRAHRRRYRASQCRDPKQR